MNSRSSQKIWGFSHKYFFNESTRIAIALMKLWAESDAPINRRYDADTIYANMEPEFSIASNHPEQSMATFRNNSAFSVIGFRIGFANEWPERLFAQHTTAGQVTAYDLCNFVNSTIGDECDITVTRNHITYHRRHECREKCSNHRELIYAVLRDVSTTAFLIYEGDDSYRFLGEGNLVFS